MSTQTRRQFMTATAATAATASAAASAAKPSPAATKARPNGNMNVVFIMTDTQPSFMVGCYGDPRMNTPNLDKLAAQGVRFDKAYTTCPLCTPARAGIFSGLHPQMAGAWCNNIAPSQNVKLMGTLFREHGYRAAYTGKWHLEGGGYFGDGVPGGGFEPDWWYDGHTYLNDIGPEMAAAYKKVWNPQMLRDNNFTLENMWGHRVASRAIDFLETVGSDPFVLTVSFDEPHGPHVAPPEYWEGAKPEDIPRCPNYKASTDDKPYIQQLESAERDLPTWDKFAKSRTRFFGCNSYIDREVGRVVDAIDRLHPDNTVIIYTSDHGDYLGAHGLTGKGPAMYEETTHIPFIVRAPGGAKGAVCDSVVSHVDILPTMLDYAGIPWQHHYQRGLHGHSLRPLMNDPQGKVRDNALIGFHRFAKNHSSRGEFYPIRAITDGRYKLAINFLETDEFYDLQTDPYEMDNRINDPELAGIRDELHDSLTFQMEYMLDPFRSIRWINRPWASDHVPPFFLPQNRKTGNRGKNTKT